MLTSSVVWLDLASEVARLEKTLFAHSKVQTLRQSLPRASLSSVRIPREPLGSMICSDCSLTILHRRA